MKVSKLEDCVKGEKLQFVHTGLLKFCLGSEDIDLPVKPQTLPENTGSYRISPFITPDFVSAMQTEELGLQNQAGE